MYITVFAKISIISPNSKNIFQRKKALAKARAFMGCCRNKNLLI